MKTISWDKISYSIDGKRVFLISGELHYFRIPREDWERRLTLFKEAGGNCVATYIPWLIHEPTEGNILFSDVPERDLEGFLKLCHELELYVIVRPGPYQYSEMKYDGLPGWLCENYPEIHAHNIKGQTYRKASVSYTHPIFLEKAHIWYEKVCKLLAKYTIANGGPIAFAQMDNEMMGVHQWYGGGWDYNKEGMGIGIEGGKYVNYLKSHFACIDKLNAHYTTTFDNFLDVTHFCGQPITVSERRRVKDYQDFYFETVGEYAKLLVSWMKMYGLVCDYVHNSPNPASNAQFEAVVKQLNGELLLGTDHYYTLGPDWPQNNPTPQYAAKVYTSLDMLREMGFPATVFELPGGSASDWPPVTPRDFEACYYTNIAFGMKGFNYYIFTGGINPFDTGAFSDVYDYGAAISHDGKVRPIYEVQKKFGEFLKINQWLAEANMEVDYTIGLDVEQSRSYSYFQEKGSYEFSGVDAWNFMHSGILTSGLCASYTPTYVDLYSGNLFERVKKALVVPTSVCMARQMQENLVEYVEKGGKLLILPVIPYMDENFKTCEILKTYLEGVEIGLEHISYPVVNVGDAHHVYMNGSLFNCSHRPSGAKNIAVEEQSGREIGWTLTKSRGGSVTWLGVSWKHSMNEHRDMFVSLMNCMAVESPTIECDNPNIWAVIRTNGEKRMLFIMNLYSSEMSCTIRVGQAKHKDAVVLQYELMPMEVKVVEMMITQ